MEIDVAWREVESTPQLYDWSLYQELNEHLEKGGVNFAPILSVHYVPDWVWKTFPDIHLRNENNATTSEYLSIWHPQTKILLTNFIKSSAETFAQSSNIYVVFVSIGMWGEIQFPFKPYASYWGYDPYATEDFKEYIKEKYNFSLISLNDAWGSNFQNWDTVNPPRPPEKDQRGEDFIQWYKESLVKFEDWMLNVTSSYFKKLAVKVAPRGIPEADNVLGIDLDAQIRVAAQYGAAITYGWIENPLLSADVAEIAHNYNLTVWAENVVTMPTDFVYIATNLLEYGYDGWFYIYEEPTVLDLLFIGKVPTKTYYRFATTIKALRDGRIPEEIRIDEARERDNTMSTIVTTYYVPIPIIVFFILRWESRKRRQTLRIRKHPLSIKTVTALMIVAGIGHLAFALWHLTYKPSFPFLWQALVGIAMWVYLFGIANFVGAYGLWSMKRWGISLTFLAIASGIIIDILISLTVMRLLQQFAVMLLTPSIIPSFMELLSYLLPLITMISFIFIYVVAIVPFAVIWKKYRN